MTWECVKFLPWKRQGSQSWKFRKHCSREFTKSIISSPRATQVTSLMRCYMVTCHVAVAYRALITGTAYPKHPEVKCNASGHNHYKTRLKSCCVAPTQYRNCKLHIRAAQFCQKSGFVTNTVIAEYWDLNFDMVSIHLLKIYLNYNMFSM